MLKETPAVRQIAVWSVRRLATTSYWMSLLLASCLVGCGSVDIPERLTPPEAAKKAMELHDANGDGKLDVNELAKVPGLAVAAQRLDQGSDGLSADEIEGRLTAYDEQSDFVAVSASVTWQNRPLVGAEVVFEPEPFMGGGLDTYRGTTDDGGMAFLDTEDHPPGMPPGFYRVRITGGSETLPDKFNTNTILGWEVADDTMRPTFHLRP